jgi:heme/copper-type cytochrome/quinol oxidase subunit 1
MQDPSLNRSQATVVVIGLGLALYILGGWLTSLGSHAPMGWVAYAPLSTEDPFGGFHPWLRLLIWLLLIAVWVRSSTALLSTRTTKQQPDSDS